MGRRKTPTQMNVAAGANRDAPYMAGKPGEFGRCRTDVGTSPCVTVAGNFKNDALRIGERMHMGIVDHPAFGGGGDFTPALTADHRLRGGFSRAAVRIDIRCGPVLPATGGDPQEQPWGPWRASLTVTMNKRMKTTNGRRSHGIDAIEPAGQAGGIPCPFRVSVVQDVIHDTEHQGGVRERDGYGR